MSSLQAQVEEQFQLFAKFLGLSAIVLGNGNLLMKLENESSSLKVYLQKSSLREKEKQILKCQIDEQNQGSKIDLQTLDFNVNVKLVENVSTLEFQKETIDQIRSSKSIWITIGSKNPYFEMLHQGPLRELRIS